jgi:hypothetical protein
MRCTIQAILVGVVVLGSSSSALAWEFGDGYRHIRDGCVENAIWPYPYMCPDRAAVRQPFEMMVCAGWRRQNLLGSHHFDPESNKLNTSGQLQVQWIMTQAPQTHRQIYVERSLNPAATAERLASTQGYAQFVAVAGESPQVFDTYMVSEGRPAQIVNVNNVRFIESMPIPTLPERDTSTFDTE